MLVDNIFTENISGVNLIKNKCPQTHFQEGHILLSQHLQHSQGWWGGGQKGAKGNLHNNLLDNVTLSFWQTPHIPNEVIVSHFVRHLVWDQTQATSQCTKDCVLTNRASSASTGSKSNLMWFLRMYYVWWYGNLISSLVMLISGSVLWW